MKSQYRSNKSVAKNPTVPISADDPRVAWNKISQTKSRQGAEVDIVGFNGKSLIDGGTSSRSPSGATGTTDPSGTKSKVYVPPSNNKPGFSISDAFIDPSAVTNVVATWSGDDLVITFDWDYDDERNRSASEFIVELTVGSTVSQTPLKSFLVNDTQIAQSVTVTKAMNQAIFGIQQVNFDDICILVTDPFYNISASACAAIIPTYVLNLPVPEITVTAIINGYSVAYTTPSQTSFNSIEVVEYESDSSTAPTNVTYLRSYFGVVNPANVMTQNFNARWVKARFYSDSGASTAYSTAFKVTPSNPVSIDNTPPNEVTAVSGVWSGDNIIISYTLPSTDPATRVQIQLTAPNSYIGQFYRFPDGSGTSQTAIITKKDLLDQFGEHYSSFSGVLKSVDSGDNKSSGVSFSIATRANPLLGITPTFTLVALSNAYSVNFTLPAGAVYAEVYAKHTAWSGDPTNDDYVVYRGLSPAVVVDTDYTTVYIKIRYYDDFNNTSNYSTEGTITPLNPGEITSIENPISFGENAVIFAGNSPTEGTRTLFKTGGIFAYDATNTSPSTQIVSNASAGTPTFITTQAQIADWKVSSTAIENTLSGTPSKYTGLSASGTYAFWAGSDVSGGNSSADFTVTPTGVVTARNISIIGNGNGSTNLISAGGLFTVKNDGTVSATSATITGSITASSGSFTGKLSIGASGGVYSGTLSGDSLSGAGFILTSEGLSFNSSTTSGITSINGTTGYFATKSANIGGWIIDENTIAKTGITGKGNIVLDSSNGYIYVTPSSVSTYRAGINSPSTDPADVVFWAGQGTTAADTSNPFRVTIAGKMYAKTGQIGGDSNYWLIDDDGIVANGSARIKVGHYEIRTDGQSRFAIINVEDPQNESSILFTDTIAGINRIYLGQTGRQVEVAKNAEISGLYSDGTGTVPTEQDLRSGGLRNMFTITENEFARVPNAFADVASGSVLLVYDPSS